MSRARLTLGVHANTRLPPSGDYAVLAATGGGQIIRGQPGHPWHLMLSAGIMAQTFVRLQRNAYGCRSLQLHNLSWHCRRCRARAPIPYITDLDADEAQTFGQALAQVSCALREETGAELVYVYSFGGGIAHLHVHLAPHGEGDALSTQMKAKSWSRSWKAERNDLPAGNFRRCRPKNYARSPAESGEDCLPSKRLKDASPARFAAWDRV